MIPIIAAALLAQASLPPIPDSMLTIGVGANSCRVWTLHRQQNGAERSVDREWLAGFLTGIEFAGTSLGARPLVRDDEDPATLIGYVDDYCARHPLESVAEAAQALWLELFQRPQS